MRLSRYLKTWPCPDQPGTVLAFSTRKASLARLPAATLARLERGDIPTSAVGPLTELGFLVPDREAETAEVLGYLEAVNRADPNVTAAVILGMACNFACPYCYEGSLQGADAMADATAEALVEFLIARLVPGKTRLRVDFYGGEPLLYPDRIAALSRTLQARAGERGIHFSFTLVSNGSLLTPAVVECLKPLGLASAKVTLDGPPNLHDRSRPYRDGRGSFASILENLRAVADRVKVGLQGNFTRETWPRFPELLDRLLTEGLGPERVGSIFFSAAQATRNRWGNSAFAGGCATSAEPWFSEAVVTLRREVLRRGYRVPKLAPSPCMVELEDAFTVNWDGTLTQCPALVGRPEFFTGTCGTGSPITGMPSPSGIGRTTPPAAPASTCPCVSAAAAGAPSSAPGPPASIARGPFWTPPWRRRYTVAPAHTPGQPTRRLVGTGENLAKAGEGVASGRTAPAHGLKTADGWYLVAGPGCEGRRAVPSPMLRCSIQGGPSPHAGAAHPPAHSGRWRKFGRVAVSDSQAHVPAGQRTFGYRWERPSGRDGFSRAGSERVDAR